MKKRLKKPISVLLACLLILLMAGCWSYKDVENLAVVIGMAIDKTDEGGYLVTVELAHPGPGDEIKSWRVEGKGKTIFDGMRNLNLKMENKPYFTHAQLVILSEGVAKEGIQPVMDIFNRNPQLRLTLHVLVSKMPTAKEIFEAQSILTDLRSAEIESMILNNQGNVSKAPPTHVYEVIDTLPSEGKCAAVPAIHTVINADMETAELDGAAVFHMDKLVGYLDGDETKNYLFVINKIQGGVLLVQENTPEIQRPDITLELVKVNSEMKPEYKDGTLTIHLKIKAETSQVENETDIKFGTEKELKKFKKDAEVTLEQDVINTIKKVQKQYNSDIFGFGDAVHQNIPELWHQIKNKWYDGLFANLKVDVKADIDINSMGVVRKPITGEED